MKHGMLFVTRRADDLSSLKDLEREWDVVWAETHDKAFALLAKRVFAVVICEDSAQSKEFLIRLSNEHPQTTRILLFDPANKGTGQLEAAQQRVPKPCSAQSLLSAVQRAQLFKTWLDDPAIKRLFSSMRRLPSLPSVYYRLLHELQSPTASLEVVGSIMAEDLIMTAKVLQLVNSAFFGLERTITSPVEAISFLGIERTKGLVLLAHAFSKYEADRSSLFSFEKLWAHSMATANFARLIMSSETQDPQMTDAAFTAGLLHDIGKLLAAANLPREYNLMIRQAQHESLPQHASEQKSWGATHAEIGACLLCMWGLPISIIEAVAYHHWPSRCARRVLSPLVAVHVANIFDHELNLDDQESGRPDLDYLAEIGVDQHLDTWRQLCRGLG